MAIQEKSIPEDNQLGIGAEHYQSGRFDEARNAFESILNLDESHGQALFYLGDISMQQQQYERAISYFKKRLCRIPHCFDTLVRLANSYLQLRNTVASEQIFLQALKLKNSASVCYSLGIIYYETMRHHKSLYYFQQATLIEDAVPEYQFALAMSYKQNTLYAEAAVHFQNTLKLKPSWPECRLELGVMLEILGQAQDAQAVYQDASAVNKESQKHGAEKITATSFEALLALSTDNLQRCTEVYSTLLDPLGVNEISEVSNSFVSFVEYEIDNVKETLKRVNETRVIVFIHPRIDDAYGALCLVQRQLIKSLKQLGYVVTELQSNLPNVNGIASLECNDINLVVFLIGINRFTTQIFKNFSEHPHTKKKIIQLLGNPPFTESGIDRIKQLSMLHKSVDCYVDLIDWDALEYSVSNFDNRNKYSKAHDYYFEYFLDVKRSKKLIADRKIPLLYISSYKDPDQIRKQWLSNKDYSIFCDNLAESARDQFTIPLWQYASELISEMELDLDIKSSLGLGLLEKVNKYITFYQKEKILKVISNYPCHLVTDSQLPFAVHKKTKLFNTLPFPLFLELLHETRCTISHLPSQMTGAFSERVQNSMIRGCTAIVAENNAALNRLKANENCLSYSPDLTQLNEHIEKAFSNPSSLNEIAINGRMFAEENFNPMKSIDLMMSNLTKSNLSR